MKKFNLRPILIFCFTIFVSFPQLINSQKTATIYIGSPKSGLLNVHHFDNEKYLGNTFKSYIKYECEPGKHLFWSRTISKKDNAQAEVFLELNVKAGETYYLKSDGTLKRRTKTLAYLNLATVFTVKKAINIKLILQKLDEKKLTKLNDFKERIGKKKPEKFSEKYYKKLDKKFNINLLIAQSLRRYKALSKVAVSNNNLKVLTKNAQKDIKKDYDAMSIADLLKEKDIAVQHENYNLAALLKSKISLKKETLKAKKVTLSTDIKSSLYSNKREQIFNEIKSGNKLQTSKQDLAKVITISPITDYKKKKKLSKTPRKDNSNILKYRRSSLYTLMIKDDTRKYSDVIINAFGDAPLLDKFNNQNIGPYLIDIKGDIKDQSSNIDNYLNTNDVAKKLIAKWFNRNEKGEFNMDLIAKRGAYDASALDISIAQNSERGMALLADAGEELISNTFVIINDYKFTNKAEVAKKVGGFLKAFKSVASYVPGAENVVNAASYAQVGVGIVGKGFVIKTTSYLYQLVWNDEIASMFYNDCWNDKNNFSEINKNNFEKANNFKLKLIGFETAWADIQSTAFTKKSDKDLIKKSTIKATNKAIAKLQRKFEAFRTKTPLLSGNPISAKIGLKEGLEKGDKFEVLEQILDKRGRTIYKRVGVVKVDKKKIWDNRYAAGVENNSLEKYTTFTGAKNKYYAGMLIRQIN